MLIKYIFKNKTFPMLIVNVTLSVILFLEVCIIASSVREYMISQITNQYHVSLKTAKISHSHIKKITKKNDIYYIEYTSPIKTYEYTKQLCQKSKCDNIKYNDKLLSLYGIGKSNKLKTVKFILIMTLFILGFAVSILIYNSFSIALNQRKKQIGIFKSIGFTTSQIILIFVREAFLVLLVSLIFGFVISIWMGQIVITMINYLLKDIFSIFSLSFYWSFILLGILFIVVIVIACSFIPILKMSRLSVLDIINDTTKYKVKRKKGKLLSKISYYNYKKNQKKYLPVVLSILISVVLYMTFNLYLDYSLDKIKNMDSSYNYQIISDNENIKKFSKGYFYKLCINKNNVITDSKNNVGLDSYSKEIIHTDNIDSYCTNYTYNLFITKNINNFENKIYNFSNKNNIKLSYVNYKKANILTHNFILAIKIVLYSFVVLVIFIGIFSIINVINGTINLRKKEFLLFKSIGFTKKEFNKILLRETFYIIKWAFISSILFVLVIDYLLYASVNSVEQTSFIIPYNLFICIIISFIIVYLILKRGFKLCDS